MAEYLQGTRGVVCTPEQVVITSGTQQSLHLVAQLLADPGDAVWLEDPGYWGARSVFRALGLKLVPVPVDADGLAPGPEHLREPPRAMFVSPSHQYPTGALMSHGRRRQLLDYAAVHGVWVVEDDYDSEFRYGARPLPALQGLDEHGRVIYLGTFSKTLFPAMRLAYLVLPPELVDAFARALNELFREGQTLQQAVLARFLAEGHYASHIRKHARGLQRPPRRADRRDRPALRQHAAGDRRRCRAAPGARAAGPPGRPRRRAAGAARRASRPARCRCTRCAARRRPRACCSATARCARRRSPASFALLARAVQGFL